MIKNKRQKTIDFEQVLCNFAGVPLKQENEPVALKHVAITALITDEQGVPGPEKFHRYHLAKRIHAGNPQLGKQDIDKIKILIGKHFVPMVVGAAYDLLDGGCPGQLPEVKA